MPPATTPPRNQSSPEIGALTLSEAIGVSIDSLILGVLEQSSDCIKMLNREGELEYINCGGLAALQAPDFHAVMGRKWWDLWPEECREMVRTMFEKSLSGIDVEFRAVCPTMQGEERHWSVKLKPMLTPDARVTGVLCTSRHIT